MRQSSKRSPTCAAATPPSSTVWPTRTASRSTGRWPAPTQAGLVRPDISDCSSPPPNCSAWPPPPTVCSWSSTTSTTPTTPACAFCTTWPVPASTSASSSPSAIARRHTHPALAETRHSLVSRHHAIDLQLAPLDRAATTALIARQLRIDRPTDELIPEIDAHLRPITRVVADGDVLTDVRGERQVQIAEALKVD